MKIITRQQGTKVFYPTNAAERIEAIQYVLDHGYSKVDNSMLDSTTANMLITVYKALNDENKIKFASFPIHKMATIGWKLVK